MADEISPVHVPPDDTRKFVLDAIEAGFRHHLAAYVAQHGLPDQETLVAKRDSYKAGCLFGLELVRQAGAREAMKRAVAARDDGCADAPHHVEDPT